MKKEQKAQVLYKNVTTEIFTGATLHLFGLLSALLVFIFSGRLL